MSFTELQINSFKTCTSQLLCYVFTVRLWWFFCCCSVDDLETLVLLLQRRTYFLNCRLISLFNAMLNFSLTCFRRTRLLQKSPLKAALPTVVRSRQQAAKWAVIRLSSIDHQLTSSSSMMTSSARCDRRPAPRRRQQQQRLRHRNIFPMPSVEKNATMTTVTTTPIKRTRRRHVPSRIRCSCFITHRALSLWNESSPSSDCPAMSSPTDTFRHFDVRDIWWARHM